MKTVSLVVHEAKKTKAKNHTYSTPPKISPNKKEICVKVTKTHHNQIAQK